MIPTNRQIHVKLYIGRPDGLTWEDVSDYLDSARVSVNIDDVVRQMQFALRNDGSMQPAWDESISRPDTDVVGTDQTILGATADSGAALINKLFNTAHRYARHSFAPRDQTSAWNWFNGQYAPLLWPNREVALKVAVTPPGGTPGELDWVTLFHGLLGDEITTERSIIRCLARDFAKLLQDTYIEEPREYGSEAGTPAETVIQQILLDNLGAKAPSLYCPVSPGFMIKPYRVEYMSVWDAIQQIATQIGWFLGYWRDPVQDLWRLTLMEPPRDKTAETADFVLDWQDDIYRQDLAINDAGIRNVVKITYYDREKAFRQSIIVSDQASIDEFGRRAMQIEEADTSLIDTEAEATAMGRAVLADLKDVPAVSQLDMPLLPTMDLFAGIVTTNPLISSANEFFGVQSVTHILDAGQHQYRTQIVGGSRVVGAHTKWLEMQTRPGSPAGQATRLIERYTWEDHFIRAPYDLMLWTPETARGGAIVATPDEPHAVRLQANSHFLSPPSSVALSALSNGGTLSNGTYYVQVSAYTEDGETTGSPEVSITLSGGTPTQAIYITWPVVSGAAGYHVWVSTAPGSIKTLQGSTSVPQYVLTTYETDGLTGPYASNNTGYAEAHLNGVLAISRNVGISTHVLTARIKLTQPVNSLASFSLGLIKTAGGGPLKMVLVGPDDADLSKLRFTAWSALYNVYVGSIPIAWTLYNTLRIVVTASRAALYINDVLQAEITNIDYLPDDAARLTATFNLSNRNADTAYSMDIDYVRYAVSE